LDSLASKLISLCDSTAWRMGWAGTTLRASTPAVHREGVEAFIRVVGERATRLQANEPTGLALWRSLGLPFNSPAGMVQSSMRAAKRALVEQVAESDSHISSSNPGSTAAPSSWGSKEDVASTLKAAVSDLSEHLKQSHVNFADVREANAKLALEQAARKREEEARERAEEALKRAEADLQNLKEELKQAEDSRAKTNEAAWRAEAALAKETTALAAAEAALQQEKAELQQARAELKQVSEARQHLEAELRQTEEREAKMLKGLLTCSGGGGMEVLMAWCIACCDTTDLDGKSAAWHALLVRLRCGCRYSNIPVT